MKLLGNVTAISDKAHSKEIAEQEQEVTVYMAPFVKVIKLRVITKGSFVSA